MPPDDPTSTAPVNGPPAGATSPALEDEEIFCPVCGYNLTGNVTGRCSECGTFFHREQLLAATRVSADALMPWERSEDFPWLDRFWRTLRISFFQPKKFALAFAAQPAQSRSTSFYAICLLLLAGIGLLTGCLAGLAIPGFPSSPSELGVCALLFVVPTISTNFAVGLAYAALYPHADRRRHLRPWRAIVEYAAAHWLILGLAPVLALPLGIGNWQSVPLLLGTCIFAVWVGSSILWAFTLVEVVRWRTAGGRGRTRGFEMTLVLAWLVGPSSLYALIVLITVLKWLVGLI